MDVIVEDSRTGYNGFLSWGFKINTASSIIKKGINWIKDHIWVPIVAGVVLLGLIIGCCVCKRRNNKRNKIAPDEEQGMFITYE